MQMLYQGKARPWDMMLKGKALARSPFESCLHCWHRTGLCDANAGLVNESETLANILLYISLVISVF